MYIVDKAEISILTFICTQYITLWLSTLKLPQYFDKSFLLYWFISISFTLHLKNIPYFFYSRKLFRCFDIYKEEKKVAHIYTMNVQLSYTRIYVYMWGGVCVYVGKKPGKRITGMCLCINTDTIRLVTS